ncbi:MAG: hypothetical protein ACI8PD_000254 [Nitrospinales bacterium]|jgi:hypothetical protein
MKIVNFGMNNELSEEGTKAALKGPVCRCFYGIRTISESCGVASVWNAGSL